MPKRRDLLKAMTVAGVAAEPLPAAHDTIYIPERHVERDRNFILSFLEAHSFAMVITANGGIRTTNVPTLLNRSETGWGSLWWHIAKSNPQNAAFDGASECVAVFHGPHGYISPNWYEAANAVPTWNFAVVHASGTPHRIDDDGAFARSLERLVQQNEAHYGGGDKWSYSELPESYLKGMRQGIVAYEMKIDRIEAKFKLGQERTPADRAGVLRNLKLARKPKSLIELTEEYYARLK